jgi:hypothetical protein
MEEIPEGESSERKMAQDQPHGTGRVTRAASGTPEEQDVLEAKGETCLERILILPNPEESGKEDERPLDLAT